MWPSNHLDPARPSLNTRPGHTTATALNTQMWPSNHLDPARQSLNTRPGHTTATAAQHTDVAVKPPGHSMTITEHTAWTHHRDCRSTHRCGHETTWTQHDNHWTHGLDTPPRPRSTHRCGHETTWTQHDNHWTHGLDTPPRLPLNTQMWPSNHLDPARPSLNTRPGHTTATAAQHTDVAVKPPGPSTTITEHTAWTHHRDRAQHTDVAVKPPGAGGYNSANGAISPYLLTLAYRYVSAIVPLTTLLVLHAYGPWTQHDHHSTHAA